MVIGTPSTTPWANTTPSQKHEHQAHHQRQERAQTKITKHEHQVQHQRNTEREREGKRDVCERVEGEQERVSERESSERATGRCMCVCVREREITRASDTEMRVRK